MSGKPARRRAGHPHTPGHPDADLPGLPARRAAARLLAAVVDAGTSLDGLTDDEHGHPQYRALEPRDRALVRAILAAALRRRVSLEKAISERLSRALPVKAHALAHVLHVGAAQILLLDIPDSAAVNLAVQHAKSDPRTQRFAALVNAVLRRIAGDRDAILARLEDETDAPAWLAERLGAAYGAERARAMLAMHRAEAPVDFTVKSDPTRWAEALGGVVLPTGTVRVASPNGAIAELPGYREGQWWVQDAAAALPARLLGDLRGRHIADLCAAPGGKTAQLAQAGARVTAVDLSANRLARLRQNLVRLGLDAGTVRADLREFRPDAPFDAVLLDAPCSSTGTIRRHPDIPWTKSREEIGRLAALQDELLGHAVRLTKPGGTIVFSNCSLDPEEGEVLVERFLARHPDVVRDPVDPSEIPGAEPFLATDGSLRTTPEGLPNDDPALAGLDGFYAVRLKRQA